MLTMKDKFGRLDGLKVAIVGDITHSRVARSNIQGLTKMGSSIFLAGPPTMMPPGVITSYSIHYTKLYDFTVREDGQVKTPISVESAGGNAEVSVGLALDYSGSMTSGDLTAMQAAAQTFVAGLNDIDSAEIRNNFV